MKKTLTILTLILGLSISSCALLQSREHRAQTKLAKAVQLDPTILQSSIKDSVHLVDSVVLKDSIRIKDSIDVRTKDSTIIIPKSDLNGEINNPCDSIRGLQSFDYKLGSGVHKLHVWSDGKKIRYSSTVDSLVSEIRSRDTYVVHLEDSLRSEQTNHALDVQRLQKNVITVVKYHPTTFQTIKFILLGLIIGFVIGKLVKVKLGFLGL